MYYTYMHADDAYVIYVGVGMCLYLYRGLRGLVLRRARTSPRRGSRLDLFARRTLATMVRVDDDDAR